LYGSPLFGRTLPPNDGSVSSRRFAANGHKHHQADQQHEKPNPNEKAHPTLGADIFARNGHTISIEPNSRSFTRGDLAVTTVSARR
jgi:hypothetical protein